MRKLYNTSCNKMVILCGATKDCTKYSLCICRESNKLKKNSSHSIWAKFKLHGLIHRHNIFEREQFLWKWSLTHTKKECGVNLIEDVIAEIYCQFWQARQVKYLKLGTALALVLYLSLKKLWKLKTIALCNFNIKPIQLQSTIAMCRKLPSNSETCG